MSDYLLSQGSRRTPQSQPIPGSSQVPNSAGGFAWEVTPWTRLRRFLILGSEGGSYYASERTLTLENASCVRECIQLDGMRTVVMIADVSKAGRAPKNDPALWALAACISYGDIQTKRQAEKALPVVARTGTHLYHFVAYAETMRGWGRLLRRAVAGWYENMPTDKLAYQAIKYRQRDGWSHRDLLRLAKPQAHRDGKLGEEHGWEYAADESARRAAIFDWICRGEQGETWQRVRGKQIVHRGRPDRQADLGLIDGYMHAQTAATPAATADLVRSYDLPREALLSEHLNSPEVWDAMLDSGMPMTAMIRNLATMTRAGVLTATSEGTRTVIAQLGNEDALRKARVHPIQVLIALLTYRSGMSVRGSNTWQPVARIIDALNDAFYASFGNVQPTGKRTLLALDVSRSMTGGIVAGCPGLDPRMATAAMAMVTARVEDVWECVGFFAGAGGFQTAVTPHRSMYGLGRGVTGISPLAITPRQRLDDIVNYTRGLPFGGTDCALPMMYAGATKQEFDTFVVYTDSETWHGSVHPSQALRECREQFVPDAKLVVVGMVSNGFSIADPNDPGMMDVVGFDTAAPQIISDFARGEL